MDYTVFLSPQTRDYWRQHEAVVGAFWRIDFLMFDLLLSRQRGAAIAGDLLEIGAYFGKSAIVLGLHARDSESTIVCDVFGNPVSGASNQIENEVSYSALSRDAFESNYGNFVGRPPRIVQDVSANLDEHVTPGSIRFAHIDGGHHYDIVAEDIAKVQRFLAPGGLVVLDDYRALHTPGVAAAAWQAVHQGLIPILLTEQKLYGTWDGEAANAVGEHIEDFLLQEPSPQIHYGVQEIQGHRVLLLANPPQLRDRRQRLVDWIPPSIKNLIRPSAQYLGD